jgi:hypothetical protein
MEGWKTVALRPEFIILPIVQSSILPSILWNLWLIFVFGGLGQLILGSAIVLGFSLDLMTHRRSGTNWSRLRWLIESNLRQHSGLQKNYRLEEKIRPLGNGLYHKNYLFEASGRYLVLRFGIICG